MPVRLQRLIKGAKTATRTHCRSMARKLPGIQKRHKLLDDIQVRQLRTRQQHVVPAQHLYSRCGLFGDRLPLADAPNHHSDHAASAKVKDASPAAKAQHEYKDSDEDILPLDGKEATRHVGKT